jgi:hypothetical protein
MSAGAFAGNPELAVPEKVAINQKACQELHRIADTYKIEGLFSKEFEAGEVCYTRMELAVVVVLLTEKLAEKVEKEGPAAVAREDLTTLLEIQEELRGEMLLARSRAFQWRYGELGTSFHALTKKISLSGGLIGVLQGSFNSEPRNRADVVGRGDLVFNFRIGDNTIAVVDVEATGGNGLDAHISNFSVLNGVAGSTEDTVRFREAWVEHEAFDGRLTMTAGKIDLTNYFDANAVANDENSQFLAGAFVNSAVLGASDIGPGARVLARLTEPLTLGLGYGSGDADSDDLFEHGFGIAELTYTLKLGEREGNYRIYGTLDGALPDGEVKMTQESAFGFGLSADQQITDKLTLFARYGHRDEDVYTTKSSWSVGGQFAGPLACRADDVLGFAYGQVLANSASAQEKLLEAYYSAKFSEQLAIAPHFQYLINASGNKDADNVFVMGLRTQITF